MTENQTLQLALEALEPEPYLAEWYVQQHVVPKAVTAIKKILTPEQIPSCKECCIARCSSKGADLDICSAYVPPEKVKKDDIVQWGVDWSKDGSCATIIKRLPNGGIEVVAVEYGPQRTWKGLTEDDKVLIKHDANFNQFISAGEYADRVQALTEARLKDKNT
jgi:hypothetical protein